MKRKKMFFYRKRLLISMLLFIFSIVSLTAVKSVDVKAVSSGIEGSDGQLHDTFYITGSMIQSKSYPEGTTELYVYADSSRTAELFYVRHTISYDDDDNFDSASYETRYYADGVESGSKKSGVRGESDLPFSYTYIKNIMKYGYDNREISINELKECGMFYYLSTKGCKTVFENPECNGLWGQYGDSHSDVLVSLDVSVLSELSDTSEGDVQDEEAYYLSYGMTITSSAGDVLFRSNIGFDRQEVYSASTDYSVLFGYQIYDKPVSMGSSIKKGYYDFDCYNRGASSIKAKSGYMGNLENITTGVVRTKNGETVDLDTYYAIFQEFGLPYQTVAGMKEYLHIGREGNYGLVKNVPYRLTNDCNIIKFINGLNAGITLSVHPVYGSYSFQLNGGNGSAPSVLLGDGTTAAPLCDAVKTGCTFAGWSQSPAAAEASYKAGEILPEINSDAVLYAVWITKQYQITYHANGGSGTMEASVIPYTGAALSNNSFDRTGYTFAGWSTSAGGNVLYGNGATIYPTTDMTLYAVWTVNKHTVTLNNTGNGASGASNASAYGSTVSIYAGTKTGHTFSGWTVDSGSVRLANASDAATAFPMPNENVSLSANWRANTYQVSVSEGGTGSTASLTAPYQSAVTISAGTKEGHTFAGWEVESGNVTLANASSETTSFVIGAEDVKIKAVWKVNTYTITVTNAGNGTVSIQAVDYGEHAAVNAGTKNGYYFCGWEIASGLPSLDNPSSESIRFIMPASDVVLNAAWKNITGLSASLNSKFHDTYSNDAYCKDGLYNVNKQITVTKDMIDVTIGFSDGSSMPAKSTDYVLGNHAVNLVGTNNIEITLTAGNSGLTYTISLEGYSPELDAVMEELGLAKGDYKGLAAKIEEMQTEIGSLAADVAKYEQNLAAIKELLAQADIDTDLTGELQERLENTQNSVKEAVARLNRAEEELDKLDCVVADMMDILGVDSEQYKDYENLSDILKELNNEIAHVKKNETVLVEEMNRIAEKLGIGDRISSEEDLQNSDFFEKIKGKIDSLQGQLDTCRDAMDKLKDTLDITNTGSLESQLDEIVEKVEQTVENLDNLKSELERVLEGLEGDDSEVNTEGMSQIEAIMAQINALKEYANGLKQFHDALKGLLGLDSGSTNEDIYQTISDIKDKIAEYDKFLDKTEALIQPEGVYGSAGLVTGEQTREELDKVYIRIADMTKQLELLKETLQLLLGREEISVENAEELGELLEKVIHQKETADSFISSIRILLEMEPAAANQEIYDKISAMKDTMEEYWSYLGKVEVLIQLEDGSQAVSGSAIVTGSAVTVRLNQIYDKLTDMVKQQEKMTETIQILLEREDISVENAEELKRLMDEIVEQKERADSFLAELRELLGLDEDAGYQEVILSVTDMKDKLNSYRKGINELMQQLGMSENGEENLQNQLDDVLNKMLDLMNQLTGKIEELEEADKKIALLEQTIEILKEQKQSSAEDNSTADKEIEELEKKLSSVKSEKSGLEKENQKQQERITELEKRLQAQTEELEGLSSEKKQLLEMISGRDKQIEVLKEQIDLLTVQLSEKEESLTADKKTIAELETVLEKQRPMQEILEHNGINAKQLAALIENSQKYQEALKDKETIPDGKVIQSTENRKQEEGIPRGEMIPQKETVKQEDGIKLEEAVRQEESTESLSVAISETEPLEAAVLQEGSQKKAGFSRLFGIVIIVMLLAGGIAILVGRKETIRK